MWARDARVLTSNTKRMSNPKFSGTTNLWSSWDDDEDVEYDAADDVRRCWTNLRLRLIVLLLFICCDAGEHNKTATDRIVVCGGYNGILQTCVCFTWYWMRCSTPQKFLKCDKKKEAKQLVSFTTISCACTGRRLIGNCRKTARNGTLLVRSVYESKFKAMSTV